MPIYDYSCDECGHKQDWTMGFDEYSEFVPSPCEKCGGQLSRDIQKGIKKKVIGVSKGGFGSSDFT
jgi:putative FmdB family regulatory protein